MLAEWQQLQTEVWELEVKEENVRSAKKVVLKSLEELQSYRERLRLAIRQFSLPGAGHEQGFEPAALNTAPTGGSLAEPEEIIGYEGARAWRAVLSALARSPTHVSGLAGVLGPQSFKYLASLAAVLSEVPPAGSIEYGTKALDDIIAAELCKLSNKDGSFDQAELFEDGSFFVALLEALIIRDPECMAWANSVLHCSSIQKAVDSVFQASRQDMRKQTLEAQDLGNITDFVGMDERDSENTGHALSNAANTLISSLTNNAATAPTGLCHLAATLWDQLLNHVSGPHVSATQCALLGEIILCRWLLPSIEARFNEKQRGSAPWEALRSLMSAIASNDPAGVRSDSIDAQSFQELSFCKMNGESLDASKPSPDSFLQEVSPESVQTEACRLRKGLLDVLVSRGQKLKLRGASTGEASLWAMPLCVAWPMDDLLSLSQAFSGATMSTFYGTSAVEAFAAEAGMPDDVVSVLAGLRAAGDRAAATPLFWIPYENARRCSHATTSTATTTATSTAAAAAGADAGSVTAAVNAAADVVTAPAQATTASRQSSSTNSETPRDACSSLLAETAVRQSASDTFLFDDEDGVAVRQSSRGTSLFAEDNEPTRAKSISEDSFEKRLSQPKASQIVSGKGRRSSLPDQRPTDVQCAWEGLLWRALAEPWALEGHPDSTLADALEALAHVQGPGPALLRLECLLQRLRPRTDPRVEMLLATTSDTPSEQSLWESLCKMKAKRFAHERKNSREVVQMQVGKSLLTQLCTDTLRILRECVRQRTHQLCHACLHSLQADQPRIGVRRSLSAPRRMSDGGTSLVEHVECSRNTSSVSSFPLDTAKHRRKAEVQAEADSCSLDLCIVGLPFHMRTTRPGPSSRKNTAVSDRGDSSRRNAAVSARGSTPTHAQHVISFDNSLRKSTIAAKDSRLARLVWSVFETQDCPVHQASATHMLSESLEHVKHVTTHGLEEAIQAFQTLPLGLVFENEDDDDPGLTRAIQDFESILTTRLLAYCQRYDPPLAKTEPTDLDCNDETSWPEPSDLMPATEQQVRRHAANCIYKHLRYQLFPRKATEADSQLWKQMHRLAWLEPRHLDVPDAFLQMPRVEDTVTLLRELHTHCAPCEMLEALTEAFHSLTEAACVLAQAGIGASGDDNGSLGADVSLPLFIMVLFKAKPARMESALRYIEHFTSKSQMLTEAGYALVQARAATGWAFSVGPQDLVNLCEGEWQEHMGP